MRLTGREKGRGTCYNEGRWRKTDKEKERGTKTKRQEEWNQARP